MKSESSLRACYIHKTKIQSQNGGSIGFNRSGGSMVQVTSPGRQFDLLP